MSILIKGVEMPKCCGECYVGFCKQIGCELSIGFDDYNKSRHHNCPLVPVPPHGRLIDADALPIDIEWEDILDAPTVIETEEERNMNLYDKTCNQKIKDGCESICWTCIHLKVCFAKDNQPCIECDQYKQAKDGE